MARLGEPWDSLVEPHPRQQPGPLPYDTGYAASRVVER